MSDRASIAVACSQSVERNTITGWLTGAGYDVVGIADINRLDDELQAHPVEALIADLSLLPKEDSLRALLRRLGHNRPLMLIGDASRFPRPLVADLSVLARPLTREGLLLSVGLSLAEGRPARRYPRRHVEPISASAQGIAVTVREASVGGVGLEVAGPRQAVLPPYFHLRIPDFGVHVLVRRAWTAQVGPALTRFGGTIEGDVAGAARPWSEFAREAPERVVSAAPRRLAPR
jgi:hypothetical protein